VAARSAGAGCTTFKQFGSTIGHSSSDTKNKVLKKQMDGLISRSWHGNCDPIVTWLGTVPGLGRGRGKR
jgi:hypothetical protein